MFGSFVRSQPRPRPDRLISADIGYLNSSILNKNFNSGGYFDFKVFLHPIFSTGLSLNILSINTKDTFGFAVKSPQVTFTSIGWINQIDLYKNKRFRLGASVNNAVGFSTLVDKANYNLVWVNNRYQKQYQNVSSSVYYLFEPGLDAGYLISNPKKDSKVFLSAKARYRSASGKTNFGDPNSISNWYFGIGINFIGLAEEQSSHHSYPTNRFDVVPHRERNHSPNTPNRTIPATNPNKNY
jgi:hypothetical protein